MRRCSRAAVRSVTQPAAPLPRQTEKRLAPRLTPVFDPTLIPILEKIRTIGVSPVESEHQGAGSPPAPNDRPLRILRGRGRVLRSGPAPWFIERLRRSLGQEDFHLRKDHEIHGIHDLKGSFKRWFERWDKWHPHRLLQGRAPGIPISLILRNGGVSPPRFSESSHDSERRL
jgi:hypothetical protein